MPHIPEIFIFIGFGFFAQLVDGALGMAYGVINMALLMSMGIPPSTASASIHTAEIFTTGISGLSHAMFKNVDYRLFRRLILPGILGSILGALLLTKVKPEVIKPFIVIYLIVIGIIILYKALKKAHWIENVRNLINKALGREKESHRLPRLIPLGLAGGFCDAIGGGGWGGFVTSTLLVQDQDEPRYTIGTVSLAEFLVTFSSAATFSLLIGISHWETVLGLIIGGAIAAPFAAFVVKVIPARAVMLLAASVIIIVSIYNGVKLYIKIFT